MKKQKIVRSFTDNRQDEPYELTKYLRDGYYVVSAIQCEKFIEYVIEKDEPIIYKFDGTELVLQESTPEDLFGFASVTARNSEEISAELKRRMGYE